MIDWHFLSAREGGQRLRGYVPDGDNGNKSGVTIATGIDLGYYSRDAAAGLPNALRVKIAPYIGLTGDMARHWLAANPLTVTKEEADLIEAPKRHEMEVALSSHYVKDAHTPFEGIPDAAQTVLASVTWQYGSTWSRCPHFWAICCKRDWKGAIAALRDFRDPYPSRRNLEADYLESHLK